MWIGEIMPNLDYIRHQLIQVIESGAATFNEVHEALSARLPELESDEVRSALKQAMKEGVVYVQSHAAGAEDSGVIGPTEEWWYEPLPDDMIVLPSAASESQGTQSKRYEIRGESARKAVMPLIPRLASFYKKGAKCTVKELVLYELELPEGGTLTVELKNVPPDSMAYLDELLQSVDLVAKLGLDSEVELALGDVVDDCTLLLELIEDA